MKIKFYEDDGTEIKGTEIIVDYTTLKAFEHFVFTLPQWVREAVVNKGKNRIKAFVKEWQPRLFADPTVDSIPANDVELVALVVARDDYKDRATRDVELPE